MIKLSYCSRITCKGQCDEQNFTVVLPSKWGQLIIEASEIGITRIDFLSKDAAFLQPASAMPPAVAKNINNAVDYINGRDVNDDIFLHPSCTDFQFQVYRALMEIPYGSTVNYKDIAAAIGRPEATRAVATAVGRNRIALLIPCHRVIPASGGYGNYRWGAALKRRLLTAEHRAAKK